LCGGQKIYIKKRINKRNGRLKNSSWKAVEAVNIKALVELIILF